MNELERLNKGYISKCDGRWENDHGVCLQSTDNPGWWLTVDLRDTGLESKTFTELSKGVGDDGHPTSKTWLHCSIKGGKFSGAGDPTRLAEIISIFLDFANV